MVTGLVTGALGCLVSQLAEKRTVLLITSSDEKAYDLEQSLRVFTGKRPAQVFPSRDLIFRGQDIISPAGKSRLRTLSELAAHDEPTIVVASSLALMHPVIKPAVYTESLLNLRGGQEVDLGALLRQLVMMGYQRSDQVEAPGNFALRGGILDIWAAAEEKPVRMELFGDTLDSIRHFNPETGKSIDRLSGVTVSVADEIKAEGNATLFDYLPGNSLVVIDEIRETEEYYQRQLRRYNDFLRDRERASRQAGGTVTAFGWDDVKLRLGKYPRLYHAFFPGNSPEPLIYYQHLSSRDMEPFWGRIDDAFKSVNQLIADGYQVKLLYKNQGFLKSIGEHIGKLPVLDTVNASLEKGFISSDLKIAVLTEEDVLGKKYQARGKTRRQDKPSLALEDLKIGDYVVHEHQGIGIFRGINRIETDGVSREYMVIQYAGADRLYLPVDRLDWLTRYSGSEEKEPKLSKMGGSDWERTRLRVQESIRQMAEDLLVLYARREAMPGFAFSPDSTWQQEFEDKFIYEETPDQAKAIVDVKADMERQRPMDRLVCGDVGYGKTEVAMRAAFKAVLDHKQVAVLVPTTILAQQHYENFKQRFADYPLTVEMVSRFNGPGEQKEIARQVKTGLVDIAIGTHRMLGRDMRFKDLGLLIIDEEHRFGVAQKEKIKTFKESVDVLSLSATPIPRTLHMALTGLRDLSVIETPPPERYPVTTYVMEYNPELIREAILKEMEREGQVFFVHNRINDIELVRSEVADLVPGARIAVAHGRTPEERLSKIMKDFVQGEYDILLSTTIIESGIDMPRVNTLIVNEADRMGLAQLYQLRGRVGRSNRLAYAYFTYRQDKSLTEPATKRLNAIREFTELGSGMKIAMRDLEIRGAGNLLGPEQHGHIEAIGFDLYVRLLEEECARLRGQEKEERVLPQLDVKIDSFIPDDYISDPAVKIQVYKQALLAATEAEVHSLEEELQDRFGPLPLPVQNLIQVTRLRAQAAEKHIRSVTTLKNRLEVRVDVNLNDIWRSMQGLAARRSLKLKRLGIDGFVLEGNVADVGLLQAMMEVL